MKPTNQSSAVKNGKKPETQNKAVFRRFSVLSHTNTQFQLKNATQSPGIALFQIFRQYKSVHCTKPRLTYARIYTHTRVNSLIKYWSSDFRFSLSAFSFFFSFRVKLFFSLSSCFIILFFSWRHKIIIIFSSSHNQHEIIIFISINKKK